MGYLASGAYGEGPRPHPGSPGPESRRTIDLTRSSAAPRISRLFTVLNAQRIPTLFLGLLAAVALPGCAHVPAAAGPAEVNSLRLALAALAPTVRAGEAADAAAGAFATSQTLAERYRPVRPAVLHNLLVNSGLKERGLCFEWAEDLLAQLDILRLETLELHWGIARAETVREHNAIPSSVRLSCAKL